MRLKTQKILANMSVAFLTAIASVNLIGISGDIGIYVAIINAFIQGCLAGAIEWKKELEIMEGKKGGFDINHLILL